MNNKNIKVAYIHNVKFPSEQANALQGIKTASALSNLAETTFFVTGLKTSKLELKKHYDISDSPLQLQSMYLYLLPARFRIRFPNFYERSILNYLKYHPTWAGFQGKKILFIRNEKELLFWGAVREHQEWLQDWIFIFEAHDVLGLDPDQFGGTNPFELKVGREGQHRQSILKALRNFDQVICVTQTLADDLASWTNGFVRPKVIQHASSLPRLGIPPRIYFGENIVLGYIGTIDQFRGVHLLLEAMKYLPPNYKLRLVGRLRQDEEGVDPSWLDNYVNDPLIKTRVEYVPAVPIKDVESEIDRCDILLQPASNDAMYSRYASPLKGYDPMVRGKPIIAADIPGHHVLYNEGKSACFYRLNPHDLAERIKKLVNNPDLAESIARAGWEQSVDYTYQRRAEQILSLAEHCRAS